jgi:hypothetical protein
MTQKMYVSGESTPQRLAVPLPAVATLAEVFPWRATSSSTPSLADEFAMFAAEALEWAELTLPTALEGWPDDNWPGE